MLQKRSGRATRHSPTCPRAADSSPAFQNTTYSLDIVSRPVHVPSGAREDLRGSCGEVRSGILRAELSGPGSMADIILKLAVVATAVVLAAPGALGNCKIKRQYVGRCWFHVECYHDVWHVALPAACADRAHVDLTLRSASASRHPHLNNAEFLADVVGFSAPGNNWTDLPRDALRHMPRLQMLHVPANRIGAVPTGALDEIPALRSLDLSSNAIAELPPAAFNTTTELERLFLANNNVSYIREDTFGSLSLLKLLDLSGNSLIKLDTDAFRGLESLENLNLNHNYIFSLNGSLEALYRLEHLYLRENKLHQVDMDEIPNFLRLQTLDVSANTLSSVQPEVFLRHGFAASVGAASAQVAISTLKEIRPRQRPAKIWLSRNKIVTLENASFVDAGSVDKPRRPRQNAVETLDSIPTEIDLSHNLIETIEFDAFQGISELISLDLSSNRLEIFEVNTTNLNKLLILNLRNNLIYAIDVETFYNLGNLKTMDLSGNDIDVLKENSFYTLRDLKVLDISNNGLEELNSSTFELESLRALDASHNSIVAVSVTHWRLEHLKYLRLHNNNISDVSLLRLEYLLELETLDLSHNRMESLGRAALAHIPALKHLNLSSNAISHVEPSAFSNLFRLLSLDLSGNELTRLEHGTFAGLRDLEELDLSRNRIGWLESSALFELRWLKRLALTDNGLRALDVEAWRGRRSPVRVSVGGNRLSCAWVAAALRDAELGRSGARLLSVERAPARAVGGIACEEDAAAALQAPSAGPDDRLLVANERILQAILAQTAQLKSSLNMLSYSRKRAVALGY